MDKCMENNYWLNKKTNAELEVAYYEKFAEFCEIVKAEYAAKEKALEAKYEEKLQMAYEVLQQELEHAEKIAQEGYDEAWKVIQDLQNRLAEAENRRCPDCGYRPGERATCHACESWGVIDL